MKVAYLSVQIREKDIEFSGKPDISYAGLCLENYTPHVLDEGKIVLYDLNSVSGLIDRLRHANLVVCFSTHCFDVLNKYYDSTNPMYYDFPIFDIHDMVFGDLEHRVYLETVAQSVELSRKVTSGLAYISLWESGRLDNIKHGILTDVEILRKAFDKIMTSTTWELIDPRSDKKVTLDISKWSETAVALSKDSFFERVINAIELIKKKSNGSHISDLHVDTADYLIKNSLVSTYKDSDGVLRFYMPDKEASEF